MNENNLLARNPKSFEELKQINQYGAEYWSARDLQPVLGYNHWRSFDNAVSKAETSCEKSGNEPGHHFARARKVIINAFSARLSKRSINLPAPAN
jgi:DNA-damage-inducible protein D